MLESIPPPSSYRKAPLICIAISAVGVLTGYGLCGSGQGGIGRAMLGALFCVVSGIALIASAIWLAARSSQQGPEA
jgi:hypothetical protein